MSALMSNLQHDDKPRQPKRRGFISHISSEWFDTSISLLFFTKKDTSFPPGRAAYWAPTLVALCVITVSDLQIWPRMWPWASILISAASLVACRRILVMLHKPSAANALCYAMTTLLSTIGVLSAFSSGLVGVASMLWLASAYLVYARHIGPESAAE